MEVVINKSKKLLNTQFYNGVHPKKQIIWHHTAGTTAEGAFSWWNQTPERVGTAYLIDRDGTILEVFDPKNWGYHLGVMGKDGGDPNDLDEKQSIGIEIVSAGHLYPDGKGKMVQYPLYPNKAAVNAIKQDEIWDMGEAGWKGHRYFQAYTDKQIDSLIALTKKLAKDFGIGIQKDLKDFWLFNQDVIKNRPSGIYSHSTVRKDKEDIIPYPAFIERVYEAFNEPKAKTPPPTKTTK
jgi:N-acetyl-anhydromuramyl-L-alanine amidase AmpD